MPLPPTNKFVGITGLFYDNLFDFVVKAYEKGFDKGRLSKTVQKCPHCNKLVDLKKDHKRS